MEAPFRVGIGTDKVFMHACHSASDSDSVAKNKASKFPNNSDRNVM